MGHVVHIIRAAGSRQKIASTNLCRSRDVTRVGHMHVDLPMPRSLGSASLARLLWGFGSLPCPQVALTWLSAPASTRVTASQYTHGSSAPQMGPRGMHHPSPRDGIVLHVASPGPSQARPWSACIAGAGPCITAQPFGRSLASRPPWRLLVCRDGHQRHIAAEVVEAQGTPGMVDC